MADEQYFDLLFYYITTPYNDFIWYLVGDKSMEFDEKR